MLKRLLRKLFKKKCRESPASIAKKQLLSIPLADSDIVIDCGANVGNVTELLRTSGATIHCFEPNPYAFEVLKKRFSDVNNVYCYQQAVSDENSRQKLFFQENSDDDEVRWSPGSSLLPSKINVRKDKYIEVEVIDLCEFILSLNAQVKILKMDIEGTECVVLKKLINLGIIDKIDYVFVETHDHKIAELREETNSLRELVKSKYATKINLDWI